MSISFDELKRLGIVILIFWRMLNPEMLVELGTPGLQLASSDRSVA